MLLQFYYNRNSRDGEGRENMKKFPLDGSVFEEKDKLISLLKNILLFTAAIGGGAALIYLLYLAANAYAGTGVKFFYPRIFCDFAQVAYCSVCKDAYSPEIGSSYSALSLFILAPFALIFKKDLNKIEYVVESAEWGVPNMQLMSSWRFWVAFLLFYAICFAALFFLIRRLVGKNTDEGRNIFWIFLLSAPALYAVIRGNMILTSLIFALIFLNWYKDESIWKRELAILSLAVSGVLKLYPLFFCAFLLHDKKWFGTARMFFYFILLYLLPSLAYNGGISGYLENLFGFAVGGNRLSYLGNISFASLIYKIVYYPTKWLGVVLPGWVDILCMALGFLLLLMFAVAAVVTDDTLKRAILSICAIALVPPVSYFYVMIFSLIPFMEYFREFEQHAVAENKQCFAFCVLLFFYPLYIISLYPLCAIALVFLGIVACVKIFRQGEFGRYMSDLKKQFRKEEKRQ